jgi:hypothetical protein
LFDRQLSAWSNDRTPHAEHQANHKQHQENEEQDLGKLDRSACDSAKTKQCGHEGHNQKDASPI